MPLLFLKRNKYGAIKTRCLTKSHAIHDSKFEAQYCNRLLAELQQGNISAYKTQVGFVLPGGVIHIVDFLVKNLDQTIEVIECKGVATDVWRLKKKLFEEKYPKIKYTVVYNRPWKKRKKKRFPKKLLLAGVLSVILGVLLAISWSASALAPGTLTDMEEMPYWYEVRCTCGLLFERKSSKDPWMHKKISHGLCFDCLQTVYSSAGFKPRRAILVMAFIRTEKAKLRAM